MSFLADLWSGRRNDRAISDREYRKIVLREIKREERERQHQEILQALRTGGPDAR